MSVELTLLNADTIRRSLQVFWNETLEIGQTGTGLALALPLCYPDGWQVVVDIEQIAPQAFRLNDSGRTLHLLAGNGQNIEAPSIKAHLEERMQTFGIHREQKAWELFRDIRFPIEGSEIQLFGEALVSIAHLHYLNEHSIKSKNVATETIERLFSERKLEPRKNHRLSGKLKERISVDFFVDTRCPVALQVIERSSSLTGYMEQWGFRWRDLKDANPSLLRSMIYDPAVQEIDRTAKAIGESVCELFCPYHEADRIHDLIDRALAGN